MLYTIIILSVLIPIMTITGFIVGYNANAPKKIFARTKKQPKTDGELLLEKIDQLKPEDF